MRTARSSASETGLNWRDSPRLWSPGRVKEKKLMEKDDVRKILSDIAELLEAGHEDWAAIMVRDALAALEEKLDRFLVSNELWEERLDCGSTLRQ